MELQSIIYDFCIISTILFISKIIRIKCSIIQHFYIPSALIAGFLGLVGGKKYIKYIAI